MAEHSSIEWTDATWNPITGCSVVSPGCTNCYAMKLAGTRLKHIPSRQGLTRDSKAGPVWTGEVRLNEQWLAQPLQWKRSRRIFVCAHGDLFAENVPDEWIDRVFAVMALAPQHTFQVLTKRAKRMREYLTDRSGKLARFMIDEYIAKAPDNPTKTRAINVAWPVRSIGDIDWPSDVEMRHWPLPNVWLGVSAEDQARAGQRVPELLATPAAIRFVSAEPLLGPINFAKWLRPGCDRCPPWETPCRIGCQHVSRLHWIIVGGESGPDARPMHPAWVREIRDQCAATRAPLFFKQWGAWAPGEWHFNLDDHVAFVPFDPAVPVEGLSNHDEAQHRVRWWEDDKAPEGLGSLRVGKAKAGRLLDGVEHNGMPEAR